MMCANPRKSLTWGAWIAPNGAKEQQCSRSTFLRVLFLRRPTPTAKSAENSMEVMHGRVAGLDVHNEDGGRRSPLRRSTSSSGIMATRTMVFTPGRGLTR